jgi:hypothetical protein
VKLPDPAYRPRSRPRAGQALNLSWYRAGISEGRDGARSGQSLFLNALKVFYVLFLRDAIFQQLHIEASNRPILIIP